MEQVNKTDLPKKEWRYVSMSQFVVGQWQNGHFDIYRSANTIEGARKARREVPHWTNAKIYDQVKDQFV